MTKGVLVVGHGSKLQFNRDLVVHMADVLDRRKEFGPVTAAFMQLNEPTIKQGIEKLVRMGVDEIYVQPCFLASGIHLTEDIPGELGFKKGDTAGSMVVEGKTIQLKYCGPIGADDRIADILADRIRERVKKG
ncbi:MAG: sirohydrochlorin nickelochelatase [Methanomassiliicoccales archaeon]|nr:MAG: sirohydrochlorin nickelochelatase [Methanomassiliicoccales archaeon]